MTKEMPDLLSCPFCGSKDFDPVIMQDEDGSWSVNCLANVEGGCGLHLDGYKTQEYAIKTWNTRAQPPSADCVMVPREMIECLYDDAQAICYHAEMDTLKAKRRGHWIKPLANNIIKNLEQYRTAAPQNNPESDITKCPNCYGPADNGHDRCVPPNPYYCTKCEEIENNPASLSTEAQPAAMSLHGDPDDDQVRGVDIEKLRHGIKHIELLLGPLDETDGPSSQLICAVLKAARAYLEMMEKKDE